MFFFFFKQKTAYEVRISDWSSDVCASDLMMGGKPYGRPMAMTEDDRRDGLALDAYTATFGPFLPVFPPGLQLSLTLQGDVVQSAEVLRPPVHQAAGDAPLRRIARLLRLLGLPALAQRLLCAARAGPKAPRAPQDRESGGSGKSV